MHLFGFFKALFRRRKGGEVTKADVVRFRLAGGLLLALDLVVGSDILTTIVVSKRIGSYQVIRNCCGKNNIRVVLVKGNKRSLGRPLDKEVSTMHTIYQTDKEIL